MNYVGDLNLTSSFFVYFSNVKMKNFRMLLNLVKPVFLHFLFVFLPIKILELGNSEPILFQESRMYRIYISPECQIVEIFVFSKF
jgi:hypothetical protein